MGLLLLDGLGSSWFLLHQVKAVMGLLLDSSKHGGGGGGTEKTRWRRLPPLCIIYKTELILIKMSSHLNHNSVFVFCVAFPCC